MKCNQIYALRGGKRLKIFKIMKLFSVFMFFFVFGAGAETYSQRQIVSLNLHKCDVGQLFKEIRKQTGLRFVYNEAHVAGLSAFDVKTDRKSVGEVLDEVFRETSLKCQFEDDVIFVVPRAPQQASQITISGKVTDKAGTSLPGVTILVKGTSVGTATDVEGNFKLNLPKMDNIVLLFTFVGMKSQEVAYKGEKTINVKLQEDASEMDEVVVTGIFERKSESFTGSVSTYKSKDLKMIGSQNVLQSLKTLDPSFHIAENKQYGSDPNRLPDIDIRGKTSVVGLKEQYETDPNQPLFILDGFETTLQSVVDLNMERVASVTILKDAASTAIYGSRAANGVVVIETKTPEAGKLRLSYNGDFSVTMPDLTDYNLMNAREKLQFEYMAEYYTDKNKIPQSQYEYDKLYNKRLSDIESGVDTYWLSEPLRTGFSHKHNLYVEGGDEAMRYGVGVSYNGISGVMEGSGRDVLDFNIDLLYRKKKFSFSNKFTLSYLQSENAPESFVKYAEANPYYKKDYEGETPKYLDNQSVYGLAIRVSNPLYNAGLNYLDGSNKMGFRNNFQMEFRPVNELKLKARIGLSKSQDKIETFKSPFHTDFDNWAKTERGEYKKATTDLWQYDGDITATYGKLFAERHLVNVVAGWNFLAAKTINDAFTAIGFPDDEIKNPAFSNQYPESKKPSYGESTRRSTSFYANLGYSFNNRYQLDANYRKDGSSVFGVNRRFTDTWSVGVSWNMNNEPFIGEWANLLKIRASVGNPGNQGFNAYNSFNTFVYNTSLQNLFGIGARIYERGNSDLKWQKTMDYNVGADVALLNNRLRLNFDVYYKDTDPLVVNISIPSSVGTSDYMTNLGAQNTRGASVSVSFSPVYKLDDEINWTISLNGRHQKMEFDKIGNSLSNLNQELQKTSLQRYRDGGNPNDIWAVRSAGIDPMTGQEIYIKKNGEYSFDYDNDDEVVVGNTEAKLEGVFGTNLYYKGFSVGAYFRYRIGADVFNDGLYNRIENIVLDNITKNQDRRALYDRWKNAGDQAQYRSIRIKKVNEEVYPMTDRFVQRENTISGESISVGYEFGKQAWLKKVLLSNMTLRAHMNDIFRASTIKSERGTDYPFARTVSFSLNMTF